MSKKTESLIDKFNELELKIIELLNTEEDKKPEDFSTKKDIKDYIKKVNKVRKLFDEYEEVAKKIEVMISDEEDAATLSKVMLDYEDRVLVGEETNELSQDEIADKKEEKSTKSNDKKIKKTNQSVKEF